MLKYLVVLLSDISTSYCHYNVKSNCDLIIPLSVLHKNIIDAMKLDLSIQVVYPSFVMPDEYEEVLNSINCTRIKPENAAVGADVIVIDADNLGSQQIINNAIYLVRGKINDLCNKVHLLYDLARKCSRLNIVVTEVANIDDVQLKKYDEFLQSIAQEIKKYIIMGKRVQVNVLTDRLSLGKMNNCNAGVESITLAPNGRLYICPAFYYDNEDSIGDDLLNMNIPNQQLFKHSYAPICKYCDAFQCKRCVWLNKKLTLEANTPSHQQCVMSHVERENARILLNTIRETGDYMLGTDIPELDYIDPLDILIKKI